jgi:hypothetical protein
MFWTKKKNQAKHKLWVHFQRLINERLILHIVLKIHEDIEAAAKSLNDKSQYKGLNSTTKYKKTLKL